MFVSKRLEKELFNIPLYWIFSNLNIAVSAEWNILRDCFNTYSKLDNSMQTGLWLILDTRSCSRQILRCFMSLLFPYHALLVEYAHQTASRWHRLLFGNSVKNLVFLHPKQNKREAGKSTCMRLHWGLQLDAAGGLYTSAIWRPTPSTSQMRLVKP